MELDANKVIDELAKRMALLEKENAILSAQLLTYKEINSTQEKLVKAYEDKEAIKEG